MRLVTGVTVRKTTSMSRISACRMDVAGDSSVSEGIVEKDERDLFPKSLEGSEVKW